tara:strand:+ start:3857 stop:4159 length:303 start_codon:yes stop_codon:yes gene_type:complete
MNIEKWKANWELRNNGTIVIMDDAEEAWDHLIVRLETLRAVGGVPAMRFEFYKYDNETLAYLEDAAIKTVLTSGVKTDEMEAAFEIAACINDVIEHRKGE